jgi:YD repeat-containing protein
MRRPCGGDRRFGGRTIERTYDLLDRLTEETTPEGTIAYAYGDAGRRITAQLAGHTAISYSYDDADRLTGVTQGSAAVAIVYDDADRRTSLTLPNGIVVEYGYEDDSRLTAIHLQGRRNADRDLTHRSPIRRRRRVPPGSVTTLGSPH